MWGACGEHVGSREGGMWGACGGACGEHVGEHVGSMWGACGGGGHVGNMWGACGEHVGRGCGGACGERMPCLLGMSDIGFSKSQLLYQPLAEGVAFFVK